MKERLVNIASAEGMMAIKSTDDDDDTKSKNKINEAQIDAILNVSGGDMRRAVTSLQSVHALVSGGDTEIVDERVIAELAGLPPSNVIDALYRAIQSRRFDTMEMAVKNEIICGGYSVQVVLQSLLEKFMTTPDLDELGRAELSVRIAEAENKMNDGADEYLQLMTVCGLALQCLQRAAAVSS
jgi:replication factor C subunit 2/4